MLESITFIVACMAMAAAFTTVFIIGVSCGVVANRVFDKKNIENLMGELTECVQILRDDHGEIVNENLEHFKQHILHEFQEAGKAHQERTLSGYYHDSDDDDEEELNDDDDNSDGGNNGGGNEFMN